MGLMKAKPAAQQMGRRSSGGRIDRQSLLPSPLMDEAIRAMRGTRWPRPYWPTMCIFLAGHSNITAHAALLAAVLKNRTR